MNDTVSLPIDFFFFHSQISGHCFSLLAAEYLLMNF